MDFVYDSLRGSLRGRPVLPSNQGTIDNNDYTMWRSNLGNLRGLAAGAGAGGLGPANVPEPNITALLVLMSLPLTMRRARKRDQSCC